MGFIRTGKRLHIQLLFIPEYSVYSFIDSPAWFSADMLLAGKALGLVIVILMVALYRSKLKNKHLSQIQQREIDQKNTFIERLHSDQEKLLKEKEWLIKEVQHRVKNSLQMVTSLLYSQSVYLKDDAAILAIKDSLRRMQAMSLIHQWLYQDKNSSTISMPEYINDLAGYLQASFEADNPIVFQEDITPVALEESLVLPLGLILTEAVVNAIKYAFQHGEQGIVCISLGYDGPDHLLMKISDNGVGLPAGLDVAQPNSLGFDLIQGLSKQLKGSLQIKNNKGVQITVRFPVQV
jgi:two-component sensor histidine kinase